MNANIIKSIYMRIRSRLSLLGSVHKTTIKYCLSSAFPRHRGAIQLGDESKEAKVTRAVVLFSRFHYANEEWSKCGSGRMQIELIGALKKMGFEVIFAGQEDLHLHRVLSNSDLIVGATSNAHYIPHTYHGCIFLLTTNSHPKVRIQRLNRLRSIYGLKSREIPVVTHHRYAYSIADYLYIAENQFGLSMHAQAGTPMEKVLTYRNRTSPDHFKRITEYKPRLSGKRHYIAWVTPSLRKGLPTLIEAWTSWEGRGEATLTVIGFPSNEKTQIINKYAKLLKIRSDIRLDFAFMSHSDIPSKLDGFDIALFLTHEDAQPSQLLEIASMGYPIITTNESGVDFPTTCCTYVSPWNRGQIHDALTFWNKCDEEALQVAAKISREYVMAYHNWDNFQSDFINDLNNVFRLRS